MGCEITTVNMMSQKIKLCPRANQDFSDSYVCLKQGEVMSHGNIYRLISALCQSIHHRAADGSILAVYKLQDDCNVEKDFEIWPLPPDEGFGLI